MTHLREVVTAVDDNVADHRQKGAERLRERASYYRHEAARAYPRAQRIAWRALASHLEHEAAELERLCGIN